MNVYGSAMHDFLMDELELGFRAATVLDDETNGLRLWSLPEEVSHWNCPLDDYKHRRLHGDV